MADKRRCQRFSIELQAWIKGSQIDESMSRALTLDVSAMGLGFVTREELALGQDVLLDIELPEEKIKINSTVVWIKGEFETAVREYKVGVMIKEPIQYDEAKFVHFIAQKMLEHYGPQS